MRALALWGRTDSPMLSSVLQQFGAKEREIMQVRTFRDLLHGIRISPPDMVLLDLSEVEGKSYIECAAALGCGRGQRDFSLVVRLPEESDSVFEHLEIFDAQEFVTGEMSPTHWYRIGRAYSAKKACLLAADERRHAQTRLWEQQFEQMVHVCRVIELRDGLTARHVDRVGKLAETVALMTGCSKDFATLCSKASMVHDIGKIGIPDAVLQKPGTLSAEEIKIVRTHPKIGADILGADSPAPLIREAHAIALSHHEWWNGEGYPHGLSRDQIPLSARIVAVCDVFDALTHARTYKPAWTNKRAVEFIRAKAGIMFDPAIAEAFAHMQRQNSEMLLSNGPAIAKGGFV